MNNRSISQRDLIPSDTVLTKSSGATPSVTGPAIKMGSVVSPLGLFLVNEGDSTSLSVTYQVGYIDKASLGHEVSDPDVSWLTPADGGAVTDMTTVDINSSAKHASLAGLSCCKFYRFIVTNADTVNGATVSLYGHFQW